ncbi:MAG: MG2 domain-containing protein [Anaerolineales bacterium]
MSRKLVIFLVVLTILITAVSLIFSAVHYARLPQQVSPLETIVLAQDRLIPGSPAAIRVAVRDHRTAEPLEGAQIVVQLLPETGQAPITVFEGKSDSAGTADVNFRVPAELQGEARLIVQTSNGLGEYTLERAVRLERNYRILLTTDKPLYQPGQMIHLRALALSAFDLLPASNRPLELIIADGKGNKVFRKTLTTTEYGVAAADFQLAGEVNTGDYKITAVLGSVSSEKTVRVEHYVLPKFDVKLSTERTFYTPGQHVKGTLQSQYFFGKPVTGAAVSIEGYTFDVERTTTFTLQGTTNAEGSFEFEFDLPAYIAGSELEGGLGRYYLQASVTDQAQHTESADLSLPVAASAIVINAVPEGGFIRPGLENILYVLTSRPDGTPVQSRLSLNFMNSAKVIGTETGEYGLAEVRFTPQSTWEALEITAQDSSGNSAVRQFTLQGNWQEASVLLRPDKPFYRLGETMSLTILTTQPKGRVYLDIVRTGQTISTRSVEITGGRADVAVDITPDLFGTLELHAYMIPPSGSIIRDTRLVVVDNAQDLAVDIRPGQDTYRPGEQGVLDIQVAGRDGRGAQAVLGLAIVDEAVFALAEQDPGFAKLYFLLEQEILKPRYDLHGLSLPELVRGLPEEQKPLETAAQGAAQASLAASLAERSAAFFPIQANSYREVLEKAQQQQRTFFSRLGNGALVVFLLLPVVGTVLSVWTLTRQRLLGKSLILALALILIVTLVILTLLAGEGRAWSPNLLEKLLVFIPELFYEGGLGLFLWLVLISFIGLIVIAIHSKDTTLGIMLALLLLAIGVAVLDSFLSFNWNIDLDSRLTEWLWLLGLFPLAFLLRLAGFLWQRRFLAVLFMLPLMLLLVLIGSSALVISGRGGLTFGAQAPMIREEALQDFGAMPLAMATPAPVPEAAMKQTDEEASSGIAQPPRLRQYFPETMFWLPDAVTDTKGKLRLEVPIADSITTWRITALASTQDGRLGGISAPLRVFQDFFIDLDLPLSLTVGDEVSLPVGVFNYLQESQSVRLELEQSSWFELLDESVKTIEIAANDIEVVYFRIRAREFGLQPFQVTAWGSKMSDAVRKEVRVYPDGKQIFFSQSDRLQPDHDVRVPVVIPKDAISGTQRLTVKIYPGMVSQVIEGLDSILRMPYGCFEQTSSTTYPNVLVLDYLQATNQAAPETQMKAEEYINLGYQRLTTFEVAGSGGFSLFGDAPADRMLTAYGLQEFSDMSRVHSVDPALIERAARWLLSQQESDGSWKNDRGLVHENTWASLGDDRLPVTAYISWSLIVAGYGDETGTRRGVQYVREFQENAKDAYVLALVANALVADDAAKSGSGDLKLDASTEAVLERLAKMAKEDGKGGVFWQSGVATFMGSEGQTGSIETTALAALALLAADRHPELVNGALTSLIRQKDSFGTWYSTQATVLTLKVLLQSVRMGLEDVNAEVNVSLNGSQSKTLTINRQNYDVVQLLTFDDVNIGRENVVSIHSSGEGNLMYQISGSYYLPWHKLSTYPELVPAGEPVAIDVQYDRTELAVNDSVTVSVRVALNQKGEKAEAALIDLGVPPGFSVQTADLDALVARFNDVPDDYDFAKIERYELTGRQILVYITNLSEGKPLEFSYRLRARFPLSVRTPASNVYDYYNPDVVGELAPQQLVVTFSKGY